MRIAGGFGRQSRIDAAFAQFIKTCPAAFPLFPHDTPQPPAYPAVKVSKHRGCLAKPKISVPTPKIEVQIANHYLQTHTSCASGKLPDTPLETNQRSRRYAPPMWFLHGETEAQEFTLPWPRHRTLRAVDLQHELGSDKVRNALHHPPPRMFATNVNITVIRIANKQMSASLQLPIQFVQYDIAKQWRKYSPNAKGNFEFSRKVSFTRGKEKA